MSSKGKKNDNVIQSIKESQTLDKKHKEIVKTFQTDKNNKEKINDDLSTINNKITEMETYRAKFTLEELKVRAKLLNEKDELAIKCFETIKQIYSKDYFRL